MNASTDESASLNVGVSVKQPASHEDDAKGAAVTMKPMNMPGDAHMGIPGLLRTLEDIKRLPFIEMVTEFKCIEGWSEIVFWGGARLRDFLAAFTAHISFGDLHPTEFATSLPAYIGFQTPDGQYYVGIEREVALHPQTLLAYEMNGEALTWDHGAPLTAPALASAPVLTLPVVASPTYSYRSTQTAHTHSPFGFRGKVAVDRSSPLPLPLARGNSSLSKALFKKSFSRVSRPILRSSSASRLAGLTCRVALNAFAGSFSQATRQRCNIEGSTSQARATSATLWPASN